MAKPFLNGTDTIAAVATAPGMGGIGIVRVSGPDAERIARAVFRPVRGSLPTPLKGYRAHYGTVYDPGSGQAVDEGILLAMPAPRSYTREDVVEISCHGGSASLQQVLGAVLSCGARIAEPGEFTRRAFLNGRIDLAQAEAVIDLIRAQSDREARAALHHLGGAFSRRVGTLRRTLLGALVQVEALIDFPEDEVPGYDEGVMRSLIKGVAQEVGELAESYREGRRLREGYKVVLVGKPNAGKSSLLNALLGEERALVTEVPGTTRDVLEETITVHGIPFVMLDTAGIRESDDAVEQLGIERSRRSVDGADIVLFVLDDEKGLTDEDGAISDLLTEANVITVINKVDSGRNRVDRISLEERWPGWAAVEVSALDGWGLDHLREVMANTVGTASPGGGDVLVTRRRHYDALTRATAALQQVAAGLEGGVPPDLVSIDLRNACNALGDITGESVDADLLDTVFQQFCLGK